MDSYDRAIRRRDFVIVIGLMLAVCLAIAAVARGDRLILDPFGEVVYAPWTEVEVLGPMVDDWDGSNEAMTSNDCDMGESYLEIGEGTTAPSSNYEVYFTPDFNGKCPVCQFQGLKSIVYQGGCMTTLMGWQPYYDEEGRYHSDDPNTTTCVYHCSNGHHFSTSCRGGVCDTNADIYEGMDSRDFPWIEPKDYTLTFGTASPATGDSILVADMDGTLRWASYSFPSDPSWWNKMWGWLLLGITYEEN